jgi:hypothetical protein
LGPRCALNFDAPAIKRAITHKRALDFEIDDQDLEAALVFAEGMGYVKRGTAEMGATVYWQATSGGVLASERNGWNV